MASFPFEFDVLSDASKRCLQSATAAFRLGKFAEAIALLDESPQPELSQIAVRKSEIYIAQRDFGSARQTLDAALVRDPNRHPNGLVPAATAYDLLRLIRGFVGIFNELKLKEAVETAREAKKRWLNDTEFGDYSELQIQIELWWNKVITCDSIMGMAWGRLAGEDDASREERMILLRHSIQFKPSAFSLELLVSAFRTEVTCVQRSAESWIPTLENLLALSLPEPDKAYLHYVSAGKWNEIGNRVRCIAELQAAESCYATCQHATGAYKVRYGRALWISTENTHKIAEFKVIASELLKAQDYLEARNVLESLSKTMEQAGCDRQAIFEVQTQLLFISQRGGDQLTALRWHRNLLLGDSRSRAYLGVGRVVELYEAMVRILTTPSTMPSLSYEIHSALSEWYIQRHDYTAALTQAEEALTQAKLSKNMTHVSEAHGAVARAEFELLRPEFAEWRNVTTFKLKWECWLGDACKLYAPSAQSFLATVISELDCLQFKTSGDLSFLLNARARIDKVELVLPDVEDEGLRSSLSAVFLGLKAHITRLEGNFTNAINFARRAITACGEDNVREEERARASSTLGFALYGLYLKEGDPSALHEAREAMKTSLDVFERIGELRSSATSCKSLGIMLLESNDATNALAYFEKADSMLSIISQEASLLRGVNGLLSRQKIRDADHTIIYANAIVACLEKEDNAALWVWSQKSKGRALLDMLGLEDLTPALLPDSIAGNSELEALLEAERKLVFRIDREKPSYPYVLRNQHEQLIKKMKSQKELATYMSLRQANVIDLDDIGDMFKENPNVVLVDWIFTTPRRGGPREIYILTVRPEGKQSLKKTKVDMTIAEIEEWRVGFLEARAPSSQVIDLANKGKGFFLDLYPLVEPLLFDGLTEPEDLLVFCPTGCLYDIPLHAIQISNEATRPVLLERNPVIYCQNFSSLRLSNFRIRQARESTEAIWYPTIFGNPDSGDSHEFRAGNAASEQLARKFGVRPNLEREVTPDRFCEEAPKSSIIFYHGHAQTSVTNVLDDTILCLFDPSSGKRSPLSAQRIFSLRLKQAPHVTLLACQTGQQEVSSGDELMGLATAFLFAGASSVLGSLWSVDNDTAVRFALKFYDRIFDPLFARDIESDKSGSSAIVDMARALRSAALDIMNDEETDPPYHWAGYVLYGSNDFIVGKDAQKRFHQP